MTEQENLLRDIQKSIDNHNKTMAKMNDRLFNIRHSINKHNEIMERMSDRIFLGVLAGSICGTGIFVKILFIF